jgi:hypothetical protein
MDSKHPTAGGPRLRSAWLTVSVATIAVATALFVSDCGGSRNHNNNSNSTSNSTATTAAAQNGVPGPIAQRDSQLASATLASALPVPLYGVTIDDISGLPSIIEALRRLARKPTARIVFDETVGPAYYRNPAIELSAVSYLMGEILDSAYVRKISVRGYLNRTTRYLDSMGEVIHIWEVGNEANGEWLGKTADVVAKISGAYDLVKARGKTAALTLYYNEDCWSRRANEMFTWTQANIPTRMKQGLDYVLVSYYEEDCNDLRPDWPTVFAKLAAMFPNSRIGFGEIGSSDPDRKAELLTRYYTMKIDQPNYIGGHFWWYFREDMVPWTEPLWSTLNSAIQSQ